MSAAEVWIAILIEIAAGALSAALVASLVPPLTFGLWKNALLGAIGGVVLTWLTGQTPGLEQFVEEQSGDAGLSADLLVGVGVAGLIGGALLVTIAGLLRNRLKR